MISIELKSVAPERIWKWGHRTGAKVGGHVPIRCKAPEKNFFGRAPSLFGSKSTIIRLGERFRDG